MDAQALRQARARAGLTQSQAAARIGVPVDTYRSWEHGHRNPRAEHRGTIDDVMNRRPTQRDEIAGLRQLVTQLSEQVRELTTVALRHQAEIDRLAGR